MHTNSNVRGAVAEIEVAVIIAINVSNSFSNASPPTLAALRVFAYALYFICLVISIMRSKTFGTPLLQAQ